jgi:hypothetical protein
MMAAGGFQTSHPHETIYSLLRTADHHAVAAPDTRDLPQSR